jgi:DNA-directed RNA polymerase alpha subunit
VRVHCLREDNIIYVGDLVLKTEERCCARRISGDSTKSKKLAEMGLLLGMNPLPGRTSEMATYWVSFATTKNF